MISWFKKGIEKFKEDYAYNKAIEQAKLDSKTGVKNAMDNPLYRGSEVIMSTGEVLQFTAMEILLTDLKTTNVTRGKSKEHLLSIRDRRSSVSTTKRRTFRKNKREYFVDQIISIREYTEEEQPKYISRDEN